MKLFSSYLIVSLVFTGASVSCSNNNNASSTINYYPKVNVYYDAARANYIYSLDSGRTWDSMAGKLNKMPATLGREVTIDSPLSEVWKANDLHRKVYGGALLNILSADTGIVAKKLPQKKVTPIIKSNIDTNDVNVDTPKKRKGFLRKIFGKKKRKNS